MYGKLLRRKTKFLLNHTETKSTKKLRRSSGQEKKLVNPDVSSMFFESFVSSW